MTLRRAIVGRRQWRQQLWILGLALVAVGLVLVVDGLWVAGVPLLVVAAAALWLCGAWVIAGTRDAYVRRLMRLWRSCATETRAAYDGFRAWEHSFSSRIRALTPPDGRAAEHERLVVLAEEEHRVRGEGRPSTEDARAVAETHRAARAIAAELGVSASGDDRSYVTSLQKLFDERDDKYASAAASVEHATASVIQKLTAIKAPGSATAEHDRLAAAFRGHLKAQRELHAAVLAADPRPCDRSGGRVGVVRRRPSRRIFARNQPTRFLRSVARAVGHAAPQSRHSRPPSRAAISPSTAVEP
jgi:hypothetical protein